MASSECNNEYQIDYISEEDLPSYEPLNKTLNLNDEQRLAKAHRSSSCIIENCSFKAVQNDGEIVGIALNTYRFKSNYAPKDTSELTAEQKSDKTKMVGHLLDHVDIKCRLFDRFPECDRMLRNELIAIRPDHQRMGIGKKLLRRSIDYQCERNVKLLQIECTNRYTARMCAKMGCEKVYSMHYKNYYVDGVNPFQPEPPNDLIEIYISICGEIVI